MTDQRFVTKNISKWLARSGLTLETLQRLHPSEQAQLGRQWKNYQTQVQNWQNNLKLSDEQLELYSAELVDDVPQVQGSIPNPPQKHLSYEEWQRQGVERMQKNAINRR